MNNLTKQIKDMMLANGADLVGVGDLADVNAAGRHGLPMGISLAVKYPSDVIRGIAELPNREYVNWYDKLNERLDSLVTLGAQTLRGHGYTAVAMTREQVKADKPGYMDDMITLLPHKTVATRAGLGWIGRCAMLVTPEYGSMVRISTILTDAPLVADTPINVASCGECSACVEFCPGQAVSGKLWQFGMARESFFDADKCLDTARKRSMLGLGTEATICGKCIEVCPHTRLAWGNE